MKAFGWTLVILGALLCLTVIAFMPGLALMGVGALFLIAGNARKA